jgi:hypothetical protein
VCTPPVTRSALPPGLLLPARRAASRAAWPLPTLTPPPPGSLQADQEKAADHAACLMARRCARAGRPGAPPVHVCVHPTTVCTPAPPRVPHPRCCRHWQAALAALQADLGEEALARWLRTEEAADMETRLLEFVTQYLQDGDAEEDSGGTGPQQSDDVSLGGQAATASSASGPDGFAGSQRGSAGSQRACLLRVIEPAALCIVPDQVGVGSPRSRRPAAAWPARGALCSTALKLLQFSLLRCGPSLPRPPTPRARCPRLGAASLNTRPPGPPSGLVATGGTPSPSSARRIAPSTRQLWTRRQTT